MAASFIDDDRFDFMEKYRMNYPWPATIVTAFTRALEIDGHKNEAAVIEMLDRAALRAVEHCHDWEGNLIGGYKIPHTPLGEASVYIMQKYRHTVIYGDAWNKAVDQLYAYVESSSQEIQDYYNTGKLPS